MYLLSMYNQATAHDMLETIVRMRQPPLPAVANYSVVFLLRDLCVALSSCIYQVGKTSTNRSPLLMSFCGSWFTRISGAVVYVRTVCTSCNS